MNFNPEIKRVDPVNTLKSEHLNAPFKPIIGGIYDREKLDRDTQYFLDDFKKEAEYVNFGLDERLLKEQRMLNSGKETYVISPCDSKNKYSLSYLDCTGVVAVGIDKETGENISFMSHQNPGSFLKEKEIRSKLEDDLTNNINDLLNRCAPGSVDVVVFGGNKDISTKEINENLRPGYDNIDDILNDSPFGDYEKSIKFLRKWINEKTGFSPVVMTGPNDNFRTNNHSLSVYFDNKNRRLYMIKPKQEESKKNEPYMASDLDAHMSKFNDKNEK